MLTLTSTARLLGVQKSSLEYWVGFDKIGSIRAGGVLILNVEEAQRALVEGGYYRKREMSRRKRELKNEVAES